LNAFSRHVPTPCAFVKVWLYFWAKEKLLYIFSQVFALLLLCSVTALNIFHQNQSVGEQSNEKMYAIDHYGWFFYGEERWLILGYS